MLSSVTDLSSVPPPQRVAARQPSPERADSIHESAARASPQGGFAIVVSVWGMWSLYGAIHALHLLWQGQTASGALLFAGGLLNLYLVGRSFAASSSCSPAQKIVSPPTWSSPPPGSVGAVPTSAISSTVERVAPPVVAMLNTPPVTPSLWLKLQRADGVELSYQVPVLARGVAWSFDGFYLKHDYRGYHAYPGHPSDARNPDHARKLFRDGCITVRGYQLVLSDAPPASSN